ncbi:MAG: hypothetical protein AB7D57_01725 [Desulfovibrionaceae bacterium]
MAVSTGTASGHLDLLDRLQTFLAAQGWVIDLWDAGTLVAHGPGASGADEVFVGAQAYADAAADAYGWTLQGFTGYTAGLGFGQPGRIGATPPILPLWDSDIPYWFVASGRRVVIVAQVSTVFVAAYLGLIKPYGSPGQYQYPLAVGGTGTGYETYRWSATGVDARQFADPGEYTLNSGRTALRLLHGGVWQGLRNVNGSSEYARSDKFVWPFSNQNRYPLTSTNTAARMGGCAITVQAPDGSPVLTPLILGCATPSRETFGELEGCFHVSGQGLAAGDLVTVDSVDHLVVQNLYRTARADYWDLALE